MRCRGICRPEPDRPMLCVGMPIGTLRVPLGPITQMFWCDPLDAEHPEMRFPAKRRNDHRQSSVLITQHSVRQRAYGKGAKQRSQRREQQPPDLG